MPIRIQPGADSLAAHAVALAVAHPFGIGDAKYRVSDSTREQVVDTVPFGVFRKELWTEMGGFNEQLLTNEDYDFYYRVRQLGGRILLGTSSHCIYFARPTLSDLARQYFRYGEWKAQMLKLHPASIKGRQIVAPLFVVALLALPLIGFLWPMAWWMVASVLVVYFLLSFICSMKLSIRGGKFVLVPFLVTAFLVIHTSWGLAFWLGLLHTPKGGTRETGLVGQE
jgi:cellulose synthase/poly-beta-1,6-N-acetylglucosamine synthase-like glycosyltransferase